MTTPIIGSPDGLTQRQRWGREYEQKQAAIAARERAAQEKAQQEQAAQLAAEQTRREDFDRHLARRAEQREADKLRILPAMGEHQTAIRDAQRVVESVIAELRQSRNPFDGDWQKRLYDSYASLMSARRSMLSRCQELAAIDQEDQIDQFERHFYPDHEGAQKRWANSLQGFVSGRASEYLKQFSPTWELSLAEAGGRMAEVAVKRVLEYFDRNDLV